MTQKRESGQVEPARTAAKSSEKPLQSWKEIAAYLERDERTARRWEKVAGLPVHRHRGSKGSSVYAYPSEMDLWRMRPGLEASLAKKSSKQRSLSVLFGVVCILFAAWLIKHGPILNSPNSLAEAANRMKMRQVWAGPGVDTLGAPSPDGRYLSYVDWETGDLALRELSSEEKRRLTNKGTWSDSAENALFSIFSPDGNWIAYSWWNGSSGYDLRVIGFEGAGQRVLYQIERPGFILPADWSSDGKEILVVLWREDGTSHIGFISVEDGSLRILKTLGLRSPRKVSLSPDDRYIVYDFPGRREEPDRDIHLFSTETEREITLVQDPSNDLYPIWTPDGRRVVFVSDRTGTMGLWTLELADGESQGSPELLKPDIGPVWPMGFTREGALYYSLQTGMHDVFLGAVDLASGEVLEAPTRVSRRLVGSSFSPDWSAGGEYLSYVSRRSSVPGEAFGDRIVIRSVATREEREISTNLMSFLEPRWSPDGNLLLVRGKDRAGKRGVFQIDRKTGHTTSIFECEDDVSVGWPDWSLDGKAIFYRLRNRGEKIDSIMVRDLQSGREKELYRTKLPAYLSHLGLSRDGQYLAFYWANPNTGEPSAIRVIPAEGGEPRELYQFQKAALPGHMRFEWTPDDKAILFTMPVAKNPSDLVQETEFQLMRISAEGGEPSTLSLTEDRLRQVQLHPDGRQIVFTAGQTKAEVWVMEDFLPEP